MRAIVATGLALICTCVNCGARERIAHSGPNEVAVQEARDLLEQIDGYEAYKKDPSAISFMPKYRDIVAQLNALRGEQDLTTKNTTVHQLVTNLSHMRKDLSLRRQANDAYTRVFNLACKRYREHSGRQPLQNPTDEEAAVVAKADILAAKYIADADAIAAAIEPKKVPVDSESKAPPVVFKPKLIPITPENERRKQAEIDASFDMHRQAINKSEPIYLEMPAQIAALEARVKSSTAAAEKFSEKNKALQKQEYSMKPGAALEIVRRDRAKAWDDYMKQDGETSTLKRDLANFKSKLLLALSAIDGACVDMRIEASQSDYAQQLLDDLAKQTNGEKKWRQAIKKTVVLKSGSKVYATSVEGLGGMYKITNFRGQTQEKSIKDVKEILDAK
jgi:hypothetical protein